MSINKDFVVEQKKIEWNGKAVCTVRGLSPHDIIRVIAENPEDADEVLSAVSEQAKGLIGDGSPESTGETDSIRSLGTLLVKVPNLVAKVIAVACDSPDDWEMVRDKFVLPLQFEIVQEVARLTFVDPPGFRRFLGNVMALVGSVTKTDQRRPTASAG